QLDVVIDMTLGHKQIFPTVVVVIEKSRAPTCMLERDPCNAAWAGDIVEEALIVHIESILLAGECIDENIGPAIVVIILKIDSHAGVVMTIFVVGHALNRSDLRECPVLVVSK